jgi:3-oxoacyl-[acyl-carrier protein] reductase
LTDGLTIDLSARTALITGGSRGIGRAVAELLARAGARVAVSYRRDEASANALIRALRERGAEAMALASDVSQPEQARQLVRDVVTAWERLDILICNAGFWAEDQAGRNDLVTWEQAFAVNARGAFLVADAAIPHLERAAGSIVFVSSTAGQRGSPRHSAYAASKGAVISYMRSLASELGPRGIHVNCVAPGWVQTDMTRRALSDPDERRKIERTIPLGRVARPDDIAGPILFLVSDLARHIQGEVLSVNGGSVMVE